MGKEKVILVIDDNDNDFLIIKRHLDNDSNLIYNDGQESVENIIDYIESTKPDVILLDFNLGKNNGLEILKRIQNIISENTISVIMLTNEVNPSVIVECLKCNAGNYLIKDQINKNVLLITIDKAISETNLNRIIREQQEEIAKLATIDAMTGLFNRSCFIEKTEAKIKSLTRSNDFISLIILDIDNFKLVNDNFGHQVGDEVLIITARILRSSLRDTDYIARYGGDEFALCLIESFHSNSTIVIRNHLKKLVEIMKKIETEIMDYLNKINKDKSKSKELDSFDFRVTTSLGMTYLQREWIEFKDLFKEADKNLYISKDAGKNRVTYKDPESHENILVKVGELC